MDKGVVKTDMNRAKAAYDVAVEQIAASADDTDRDLMEYLHINGPSELDYDINEDLTAEVCKERRDQYAALGMLEYYGDDWPEQFDLSALGCAVYGIVKKRTE